MKISVQVAHIINKIISIIPVMGLFNQSKFNRISAYRLILAHVVIVPLIGYIRYPYIRRKIGKRLQKTNKQSQKEIKSSLSEMQIDFDEQTDYMLIIQVNTKKQNQVYEFQKQLRQLNSQLQQKQVQFNKVRFIFMGSQQIYEILQSNQKQSHIEFHQNQNKGQTSQISLLAKDSEGQSEVLMQWPFSSKTKSIIRQISKHKYKKFVQSMNF